MPDDLFTDIGRLHRQIHRDDPPAANESERQAAIVLNGMQRVLLELTTQNVHLRTLELGLFYQWLRLAVLTRGFDDAEFNRWSTAMDTMMIPLIDTLKSLAAKLDDDGPAPLMEQLGDKVQTLRDLYQPLINQPLPPQAEIERMTAVTNEALFGFVGNCLNQGINPRLLENTSLYYWLRTSTIVAEVPETFFQTLERHWPTVITRVDKLLGDLLGH